MRSILSMFAKSPFKPLVSHMDKVRACVEQVKPLFDALDKKDYDSVQKISELIVKLEHEADIIKDDIRNHMRQSMFLPVDKKDFMHLLSAQDDIADAVEDLAVLLRIKNLDTPGEIKSSLKELVGHIVETAHMGCDLISELDTLLEASFGGAEAEKWRRLPKNSLAQNGKLTASSLVWQKSCLPWAMILVRQICCFGTK